MAEAADSERTILKVLNGLQSGVEVSLTPGEYSLGSGPDDDIQLVDVSLRPGHLRLKVAGGKIQIAGGAGSLRTSNGLIVAAGNQDWQEIEPLDVVAAGTTRFALGPPTAKWSTITEDDSDKTVDPLARGRAAAQAKAPREGGSRLTLPLLIVLALLGVGGYYAYQEYNQKQRAVVVDRRSDTEILREALDQLPFGRAIEIRREVDGTTYASGYVESPVERRAVVNAIEKTGLPVYPRIWVLSSLRSEVENLIRSRQLALTAAVAPTGEVALDGVVLDADAADRFVALVRDNVVGIKALDNRIRTAKTLVRDVERLARQSQVDTYVLFRLDRELIEASGVVPVARMDSWIGFLQSYSARYAKDIGLRSLVQLQNEAGERSPAVPVVIGGKAGEGEIQLDPEQLRQGRYDFGDLFFGGRARPGADGAGGPGQPGRPGALGPGGAALLPAVARGGAGALGGSAGGGPGGVLAVGGAGSGAGGGPGGAGGGGPMPEPAAAAARADAAKLRDGARAIADRWRAGGPISDHKGASAAALSDALAILARSDWDATAAGLPGGPGGRVAAVYLPLLKQLHELPDRACWPGARVSAQSLPASLFWLDLLSASTTLTLATFEPGEQRLLLETAMNPRAVAACAGGLKIAGKRAPLAEASLYLAEIRRNPEFVRFLVRDLPAFALDVTGANIGEERYVQVRDGRKLPEGIAPETAARIISVGELGAVVQVKDGNAVVVFEPGINWLASSRF